MQVSDFHFDLPEELIANVPSEPRDACNLMVLDRNTDKISHLHFFDLVDLLREGDALVLNDTKVFPARLYGAKETGGKTEVLLLRQINLDTFSCLGKGRLNPGQKIKFSEDLFAEIIEKSTDGELTIQFNKQSPELLQVFEKIGHTPLPPYIHSDSDEALLRLQYQTVYAKVKGSAAAPTAGLHFTELLLEKLLKKGIQIEKVTLHVGLGTFKPITDEQITTKTLHTEWFEVNQETATRLNAAKQSGRRIIAVGTTACRVLESSSNDQGVVTAQSGETSIFIQPGYRFKMVDGLITNFHLSETSLLMLVTALVSSPNTSHVFQSFSESLIGQGYQEAILKKYRFFSFGDAMLII